MAMFSKFDKISAKISIPVNKAYSSGIELLLPSKNSAISEKNARMKWGSVQHPLPTIIVKPNCLLSPKIEKRRHLLQQIVYSKLIAFPSGLGVQQLFNRY